MANGDEGERVPDEQLIAQVAELQPQALAALYDRHAVAAFSLARRMLGSDSAEDAVQEGFLSLWRNAAQFDANRGSPRTWLLGMVRNRCLDTLRRLHAHERRRIAQQQEASIGLAVSTEAEALRSIEGLWIREALAALPTDQRRPLELAYFGGWTHSEIAEQLDVPLGTVKSRTRLALEKLRDSLEDKVKSVE